MRKIILFAMASLFLMSCGGPGKNPDDLITWGQAWNHVSHSWGYWIPLLVVTLIGGYFLVYRTIVKYKAGDIDGGAATWRFLAFVVAFAICLLIRPCEVAANTTVDQALRNKWIGY